MSNDLILIELCLKIDWILKTSKKYRLLIFSLIFSFLAVSGFEFLHKHDGLNFDESHCPICIIIHSISNVDLNTNTFTLHPVHFEIISFQQSFSNPQQAHTSVLSDRAPPSFS